MVKIILAVVMVSAMVLIGCDGETKEIPPTHPLPQYDVRLIRPGAQAGIYEVCIEGIVYISSYNGHGHVVGGVKYVKRLGKPEIKTC